MEGGGPVCQRHGGGRKSPDTAHAPTRRRIMTCKGRTPAQGPELRTQSRRAPSSCPPPRTGGCPGRVRAGPWGAPRASQPSLWEASDGSRSPDRVGGPALGGTPPPTPEWMSDNLGNPACAWVQVSALGFVPKGGPAAKDPVSLRLWISRSGLGKLEGCRAEPSGHRPRQGTWPSLWWALKGKPGGRCG